MAKKDTLAAIKAANGTDLDEAKYTQNELDKLLVEAEKGEAGKEAFSALLKDAGAPTVPAALATVPATPATAPARKAPKDPITVKVHPDIAAYDGEFTDPDSKDVIGKAPVTVERTAFVTEKLRSGEISEVKD